MAKRFKLNVGDVFSIPLNDEEIGFGQCITPHDKISGGFMIAVYPLKTGKDEDVDIEKVVNGEPVFLGFTFDSLLRYLPKWKIIGNYIENIVYIIFPFHRVISNGELILENVKDEKVATLSEDVFKLFTNKIEIAPIRYENALKAYFGYSEWKDEDYDEILYKNAIKSNEIAQKVLSGG